ncbi:MAG: hypothetical protein RIQ50_1711 [Bacteroidota bacterium]|jgi:hexosaminidase
MKRFLLPFLLLLLASFGFSQSEFNLIPYPKKVTAGAGQFTFKKGMQIQSNDAAFLPIANLVAEQFNAASGLSVVARQGISGGSGIQFKKNPALAEEAYVLEVTSKKILIEASSGKGAFYAVQTLFQLRPASAGVTVPAVRIEDEPRLGYRGLMLDVGRYFFSVADIKRFLDIMAMYKLNTFHWHLTEDQGWRIEIKKYPLLTQISSVRKETTLGHLRDRKLDGKPHGGFYTQDQIREVIAYASSKYITIIPEIEMPGHSQALLAAYPQLGCNPDKIYQVATMWGVSEDVLCPREETFAFMQGVLTEVMELFPGQYIHIGGDECPKKQWKESRFCQNLIKQLGLKNEDELQSYFIKRIDKFITSKGKKMLGWDEILEGGLSPNAMVMSWRGVKGGVEAAAQKHQVVMTPNSFFYLDYYQGDPKTEPLAIGGNLPLSKTYSFDVDQLGLSPEDTRYIVGVQANVWTEYISNISYAEYMTYPRALALAEIGWSPREARDFESFKKRLIGHLPHMDAKKINYSKAFLSQK